MQKNTWGFSQQILEAIRTVFQAEVLLVDPNRIKVAGTSFFTKSIGEISNEGTILSHVLKTGMPAIIANPRENDLCKCTRQNQCKEAYVISCPVILNDKVIGALAVISLSENQRKWMVKDPEGVLHFFRQMADLIATKVHEKEISNELNLNINRINALLESSHEGIIAIGPDSRITHFNKSASLLTSLSRKNIFSKNIKEVLPGLPLWEVLKEGKGYTNTQITLQIKGTSKRFLSTSRPIIHESEIIGVVATLRDFGEIHKSLYHSTEPGLIMLDDITGKSPAFRDVREKARLAARNTYNVLIHGESGTGKELFARALHAESNFCEGPFIAINCSAIPAALLESELFGYEEGSFTGARRGGKIGKFELANGGTIFLDEVGDMPINLQVKLLRVLQERVITRVGSMNNLKLNIRVVAASNADLKQKMSQGEFREDLYYRLNVIPLEIPPLRERNEDIMLLALHFLSINHCTRIISKQVEDILINYQWPGNIRELENVIQHSICFSENSNEIRIDHLPKSFRTIINTSSPLNQKKSFNLKNQEKECINKALEIYGTNNNGIKQAAKTLGICRATLYRKIKLYDLDKTNIEEFD